MEAFLKGKHLGRIFIPFRNTVKRSGGARIFQILGKIIDRVDDIFIPM